MQSAAPALRRQFDRKPVKANAFVYSRGGFQRAKVVDYSEGGLQLDGTFGLVRRDVVELQLISGRRLSGQVAWSVGRQTGIVFSEPLHGNHPAMIELLQRSKFQ
jgi:hypothetical protein